MELIRIDKDRYLVKNSNGRIVSKKELKENENSSVEKTKQVKRTNSKSKRTRN